jgi:hypothetical protein
MKSPANGARTLILSLAFVMAGFRCASDSVVAEKPLEPAGAEDSKKLLARVIFINRNSAESYTAGFTGEALLNKKKVLFMGTALFNKNPRMMKYNFLDTIFKSPITTLVQDGEKLKIYFPVDQSLYLDNTRTIQLKNYLKIDADFQTLYPFAAGQIPFIKDYAIRRGLEHEKDSGVEHRYLILENGDFYQTVAFKGDIPDKLLFLRKDTKQKIEVYLEKPYTSGNTVFYQSLRVTLLPSGDRLSIDFKDIVLNKPMDPALMGEIPLRRGTRFINMEP